MAPPLSPEPLALSAMVEPAANESVRDLPADVLTLLYRHMRVLAGPRHDLDDLVQAAATRLIRALPASSDARVFRRSPTASPTARSSVTIAGTAGGAGVSASPKITKRSSPR